MSEEVAIRTYEVVTSAGVFRVTVPASARVSYGPVIGAAGKSSYGGNCLRIWEGTKATEVQRALFSDVQSFRDLSLPMEVKAVRMYGREDWWPDDGTWVGPKNDLVEKAWKLADEVDERPRDLPTGEDIAVGLPHTLRGMSPRRDRAFTVEDDKEEVPF